MKEITRFVFIFGKPYFNMTRGNVENQIISSLNPIIAARRNLLIFKLKGERVFDKFMRKSTLFLSLLRPNKKKVCFRQHGKKV